MSDLTIISVALLGLLVFVLGANVTRHRAMRGANGGPQVSTDPTDRLFIAIRAHGNAAEYVPTLAVLILLCSYLTEGWWVAALTVIAVGARYLHAYGMLSASSLAEHGPIRDFGAIGTYVAGLALAVTAVVSLV